MLKLIRPINLFIIALTLYLVRYCLMQTQLHLQVLDLQMEDVDFFLLTLSVVFIAAAGYIINDVFDTDTDAVNRPNAVLINNTISKKTAMAVYMVFNIVGLLLALYVANNVGLYQLAIVHFVTIGLLWFYSSVLKRIYLIGNIIVAKLSAIVVFIPILFEPARAYINSSFILGYAIFAFLLSLMRELIKDAEDVEGDKAHGCKTLAVVSGVKTSKVLATVIGVVVALFVLLLQFVQFKNHDYYSFAYFTIAIQLPLLMLLSQTWKSATVADFHKASNLNKIIMLTGILSMLVFRLTL